MSKLAVSIALLILISGCLAATSPYCRGIANELEEAGKSCKCAAIWQTPEKLENHTDAVKPLCRCTCTVDGTTVSIDIAQSKS